MSLLSIKWSKFQSPDFILVKWLSFFKAIGEVTCLLLTKPSSQSLRLARLVLMVKPWYTMVSTARLENLYERVREAEKMGIAGDIVECGCWHGGSGAVMGAASLDAGGQRTAWLFDSFQGLPPPGDKDGQREHDFYFDGWCKGDTDKVRAIFRRVGFPLEHLKIVPGWFQDTLPYVPVQQIAVLHVDADWYESVKLVLETLYDRVTIGGFVVIDDYFIWPGCKQAVDEFRAARGIHAPLHSVTNTAAYFQKER
jgi:O-methyltransferase